MSVVGLAVLIAVLVVIALLLGWIAFEVGRVVVIVGDHARRLRVLEGCKEGTVVKMEADREAEAP